MGVLPRFVYGDDDLFEQRAQQLLAVARRGCGRLPHGLQVGAQREQAVAVFCAERARPFPFAAGEFGFGVLELAQALLPLGLEAACDESVLGVDGAIAALGTLRLVAGALGGQTPLAEDAIAAVG